MKTHKNLWGQVTSFQNLLLAWRKAKKGKTQKEYVKKFEENILDELFLLQNELENQTYFPRQTKTFVLRDPKTRKITKSDFRDRVIHHAICNVIDPIFDKTFIHENSANRKNKGSLFALKILDKFKRKVTNNLTSKAYFLKADIKHYFQEVNHEILLNILKRKIRDTQLMWLIKVVIERERERERDMQFR